MSGTNWADKRKDFDFGAFLETFTTPERIEEAKVDMGGELPASVCAWCRKPFNPKVKHQIYCGVDCDCEATETRQRYERQQAKKR